MFRIGGQEKREYLETGRELEPAAAFREEYSPCDAAKAVSATTSLFSLFLRSKSHIFLYCKIRYPHSGVSSYHESLSSRWDSQVV